MHVVTPAEIESVAWEGELVAPAVAYALPPPQRPVVTIGQPAIWPVAEALEARLGQKWVPPLGEAEYWLDRDPASGEDSLVGIWRNPQGGKCGELLFHADGTFFAEYDVIRVHPRKPRWFVEAVTAWGRGNTIKSEPRLLPVAS